MTEPVRTMSGDVSEPATPTLRSGKRSAFARLEPRAGGSEPFVVGGGRVERLELWFTATTSRSLPYSALKDVTFYAAPKDGVEPDETIALLFSLHPDVEVFIRGVHLHQLYSALSSHSVSRITQGAKVLASTSCAIWRIHVPGRNASRPASQGPTETLVTMDT